MPGGNILERSGQRRNPEPRHQTPYGVSPTAPRGRKDRVVAVFVLDKRKKPLMPCSEKRAWQVLERGRAVVHRMYPFTIRLRDRVGRATQPIEVRIDPGSKSTGVAVIRKDARIDTVLHLAISQELVRFDMRAMETPGICGVEYQQGTLKGYEIREYLLEKWGRCCAYCDATGVPLQIEHITRIKAAFGFRTGDMVRADIPAGVKSGTHTGRVVIHVTGSFNIQTPDCPVQGISHRHCRLLQRGDGYGYTQLEKASA